MSDTPINNTGYGYIPEYISAEELDKLSLEFAKALAQQSMHDPSGNKSRRKSRKYSVPTKEEVESYLEAPTTNEKNLRNASILLYQTNTRYRNLLNYYSEIPCWLYTISPVNYNPTKSKKSNFEKQYYKVCSILESMAIPKMMREIVITALREGAYYGCVWGGNGDSFILQKLDADNCVIVSVTDGGVFQFAYDMSKVNEDDLETYYPPEFKAMYQAYAETGNQYQTVPPEISICFKADPTIVEYSIPVFCGTFLALYALKNSENLAQTAQELSNYKLLAGKIPTDDRGIPLLKWEAALQYYTHLANNVGDRVGVAMTPFDLKDFSFEQSSTAAQVDIVSRANENFFSSAGTSALLHGATNATTGVTKLSVRVDEAFSFGLMYQCEQIVNRYLKLLSGNIKFKIHFLDISCFNRQEMIEQYRAALNYGIGKLEFIVAMGIRQHDILGENYIETDVLNLDDLFTPLKTSSTMASEGESGSGRPETPDSELSDEGEATRDGEQNENQ